MNEYCDTFSKQCKPRTTEKCGDGFCAPSEDETSCPSDCETGEKVTCGDGVCSATEDASSCSADCITQGSNGKGALFWISLIIIILIIGVGGYFGYNKFFKKKPPTNKNLPFFSEEPQKEAKNPRQNLQRRVSRRNNFDESLENELDKSIKEAERLLKK